MMRIRVGIAILALAITAIALELTVPGFQRWTAGHQLTVALVSEAMLVGFSLALIQYVIKQSTMGRWREAASPALFDLLNSTDRLHRRVDVLLNGNNDTDDWIWSDFAVHENLVGRYSALLTSTPELARIYAATIRHLTECRELIDRFGRGSVPPISPSKLNAEADVLVGEIGAFSRAATPIPFRIQAAPPRQW